MMGMTGECTDVELAARSPSDGGGSAPSARDGARGSPGDEPDSPAVSDVSSAETIKLEPAGTAPAPLGPSPTEVRWYSDPSTASDVVLRRSYATVRCYWPRDPKKCRADRFPGHAYLVERRLVPLGWAEDAWYYYRNNHPLLSLFLADGAHTFPIGKRWIVEVACVFIAASFARAEDRDRRMARNPYYLLIAAAYKLLLRQALIAAAVCPCLRFDEDHEDEEIGYRNSACCCVKDDRRRGRYVKRADGAGTALIVVVGVVVGLYVATFFLGLLTAKDRRRYWATAAWWAVFYAEFVLFGYFVAFLTPLATVLNPHVDCGCCCCYLVGKWRVERDLHAVFRGRYAEASYEPPRLRASHPGCCLCGCLLATADFSAPAEGAEPCCLPRWYALRFWRRCCELSKLACICCPACMGCCVPASQGGVRAGVANPRDGLVPKPPKPKSDADLLRASPSGLWGAAGDGTA